jgi:hypothetical protein
VPPDGLTLNADRLVSTRSAFAERSPPGAASAEIVMNRLFSTQSGLPIACRIIGLGAASVMRDAEDPNTAFRDTGRTACRPSAAGRQAADLVAWTARSRPTSRIGRLPPGPKEPTRNLFRRVPWRARTASPSQGKSRNLREAHDRIEAGSIGRVDPSYCTPLDIGYRLFCSQ